MNVKGLTIGDKVQIDGLPHTIDGLAQSKGKWQFLSVESFAWIPLEMASPIFITQKFLEKNFDGDGFEYGIFEDYFNVTIREDNDGTYSFNYHITEMDLPDTSIANICYVHELQHALCSCGIEKELEL